MAALDALRGNGRHAVRPFPRLHWSCFIGFDRGELRSRADATDRNRRFALHFEQQRHFAAESETRLLGYTGREDGGHSGIHGISALH